MTKKQTEEMENAVQEYFESEEFCYEDTYGAFKWGYTKMNEPEHLIFNEHVRQAITRIEGMVLSLETNGQNINVEFHVNWLKTALKPFQNLGIDDE